MLNELACNGSGDSCHMAEVTKIITKNAEIKARHKTARRPLFCEIFRHVSPRRESPWKLMCIGWGKVLNSFPPELYHPY